MKYFVIADVHGFYDEMIAALNQAGFNESNPEHMLISLGDAFDRGNKPIEVMNYLTSLSQRGKAILIKGNHEYLMEELLHAIQPHGHDFSNGTFDTVLKLAAKYLGVEKVSPAWAGLDWAITSTAAAQNVSWQEYQRELVDYYETQNFVFVHGWLPLLFDRKIEEHGKIVDTNFRIDPNYAVENDRIVWENASWENGAIAAANEAFHPTKVIVCGHMHASAFKDNSFDNHTYYGEKVIACDGCTALTGFVNCVMIDDDEDPKFEKRKILDYFVDSKKLF